MSQEKPGRWDAFIHAKCPHCFHGDMFVNKNPYALGEMTKMPQNCPVCGHTFFPETGFYWGSMYMSYVFTVVFSAINVVLIGLAFGFEIIPLIVGNALLLCLSFPLFFRYSRVIWLHLNVNFSPEAYSAARAHDEAVQAKHNSEL